MYNALKPLKTIALFLFFTFIDQFLKYIIRTNGGFYICNKGVAFGMPFVLVFLLLLIFFSILSVFNLKFKIINLKLISNYKFKISNYKPWQIIPAILIVSGAVSNIIDRIYFNCVIDFIDIKLWPVFNLADIYITIGSIILVVNLFKKGTK